MKRLTIFAALSSSFLFFGGTSALAVPLACDVTTATECQITSNHIVSGPVEVSGLALHITAPAGQLTVPPVAGGATLTLVVDGNGLNGLIMDSGGKITGDTTGTTGVGATLNITVTTGNVVLTSGAAITADNTAGAGCGSGHGGVINLTASGSNATITTDPGTRISVNGSTCSAGAINISAPNFGAIDVDGSVLSQSAKTGGGNAMTQQPGGGPIFITAACNLTVSDTGVVSSKGLDPGADLVHLQGGCDVLVNGLVESTGVGHAIPRNPPTSCTALSPNPGSVRRNLATRPDKPVNSAACVEVWAGSSLTINKDVVCPTPAPGQQPCLGARGEINADTGHSPGGASGTSWIDLFALGDIKVQNATTQWAVHANGNAGTDNGGVVTVKTAGNNILQSPGNILLTGFALQASAANHGQGGTVDVESAVNVDLRAIPATYPDGKIEARGGDGAPADHGGHVIILSMLDIKAGPLSNLNVAGHPNTAPQDGTILLRACNNIDAVSTSAGAIVTLSPTSCPTLAPFQPYVQLLSCPCQGRVCVLWE